MRFLSIAALVALAASVIADSNDRCDPGKGLNSKGNCENCPSDTFGTGGTAPCRPCPAGSSSDRRSSKCECDDGFTSSTGYTTSNACVVCPAGHGSNDAHTSCSPCKADTYSKGGICYNCPTGYTSSAGATTCEPICPAGTRYRSGGSCQNCPAGSYSNAGDLSCTSCPTGWTSPPGSGSCSPRPSGQPQNPPSKRSLCAGPGMKQCDVWSGRGGSECINTLITLDSCGGCVGPEGDESNAYTGQDCSTIPYVNKVSCVQGKCQVESCRTGYEPSGTSCVESPAHVHSRVMKRSYARQDSF